MPQYSEWMKAPMGEGYYWADDGRAITLVYVEEQGGQWIVWDPLDSTENRPVHYYVQWSHPLVAPLSDDED